MTTERVRFAEFVLDLRTRELLRGDDQVVLSPKALQLLEILVLNRPTALSKSDLQNRLWPDTFVLEKNLANLVSEIREGLDDDAAHPRFIRTVPRFGYAFLEKSKESGHDRPGALDTNRDARFRLVWSGGRVALGDGAHVLGRDPDLALFLDSPTVSRRHAIVRISGTEATLEDLGSKNGTFIDEHPCDAPTPLVEGNVIRVGSVTLRVRLVRALGSTVTGSRSRR